MRRRIAATRPMRTLPQKPRTMLRIVPTRPLEIEISLLAVY